MAELGKTVHVLFVEAGQQTDTSMNGESKENGGDGKRTL